MEKILVQKKYQFESMLADLREAKIFAYDTETNGQLNRFQVSLVGISVCCSDDKSFYIPLMHNEGEQLEIDYVLRNFACFLESPNLEKICHNAKYDEMVMSQYDINVRGPGNDTFVMSWLLDEAKIRGSHSLKALVKRYFDYDMETYEEVISSAPKKRGIDRDYNFAKVELDKALSYAADDSYWCWKLFWKLREDLYNERLWKAYKNVERPFNRVLGNIEARGVCIDLDAVEYADKRLPAIAESVEAAIYEEAGEVFKIGSGKQLGHILYEKLGIGKNVPRTKTGNYSTDKKTLENYAGKHTIVENVLRTKKIKKTHSTFVEGIKTFIAKDGKVHPSFNGCGTATGRLSGSNPNLQQIEGDEVEEVKVRNFFIASPEHDLIVADYSQIELRIMAHFSRDEEMMAAFIDGTTDFHDQVARRMFKIPNEEEVTRRQRVVSKTLNFGVGYGRGPKGIAEQLEISQDDARAFIANWFKKFRGVAEYKKHLLSSARRDGFIRTLTGRKRRLLPDIRSDDWLLRGRAERQAFNTKIQGSAADVIKIAMNSLDRELPQYRAHMIIQIHDELVIECPKEFSKKALGTIKEIMENPLNGKNPLRLPLVVEPVVVERWGDAK